MSKKPAKLSKPSSAGNVVELSDCRTRVVAELKAMCGVDDEQLASWLPRQLMAAMGPDTDVALVKNLLLELEPRNLLETMVATQLVALYACAMNQLALSRHPENDTDGINLTINRASKLMRVQNELMQTWLALRGKRASKQSVVVKHVTVQSGGQAIVGAVSRKTGGEAK